LNTITGQFYVGSAINFDSRWHRHTSDLNKNKHHCSKLQEAWDEYGKDVFVFKKHEHVDDLSLLLKEEQKYIDQHWDDGVICYNKCKTAGSWLGMKHTEETKVILSKAKQGTNNVAAKLTEEKVAEIKELLLENKLMVKEIAIKFDIDRSIISKMIAGERWTHCFTDKERTQLQQLQKENKRKRISGKNNPMNDLIALEKNKIANQGEGNSNSKLTTKDVIKIKEMIHSKYSINSIAELFKVHASVISKIKSGVRWTHIK
jgi:group I intron endonuclease